MKIIVAEKIVKFCFEAFLASREFKLLQKSVSRYKSAIKRLRRLESKRKRKTLKKCERDEYLKLIVEILGIEYIIKSTSSQYYKNKNEQIKTNLDYKDLSPEVNISISDQKKYKKIDNIELEDLTYLLKLLNTKSRKQQSKSILILKTFENYLSPDEKKINEEAYLIRSGYKAKKNTLEHYLENKIIKAIKRKKNKFERISKNQYKSLENLCLISICLILDNMHSLAKTGLTFNFKNEDFNKLILIIIRDIRINEQKELTEFCTSYGIKKLKTKMPEFKFNAAIHVLAKNISFKSFNIGDENPENFMLPVPSLDTLRNKIKRLNYQSAENRQRSLSILEIHAYKKL